MQLFCESCGKNHEFAPSYVEKLVYALQAELATTLADDHGGEMKNYYDRFKGVDGEEAFFCLDTHHTGAMLDTEMYYEWVNGEVEARQRNEGVNACEECGDDCGQGTLCNDCMATNIADHPNPRGYLGDINGPGCDPDVP